MILRRYVPMLGPLAARGTHVRRERSAHDSQNGAVATRRGSDDPQAVTDVAPWAFAAASPDRTASHPQPVAP